MFIVTLQILYEARSTQAWHPACRGHVDVEVDGWGGRWQRHQHSLVLRATAQVGTLEAQKAWEAITEKL